MAIFVVKGLCFDFLWHSFIIEATFNNYLRPGIIFCVKPEGNSVYTSEPCRGLKTCCVVRWVVLISRGGGGEDFQHDLKDLLPIIPTPFSIPSLM